MEGFSLPNSAVFDQWQAQYMVQVRQEIQRGMEHIVRGFTLEKDYAQAIQYGLRWLSLDPLQERVHRELIHLYALNGQRELALLQHQACTELLARELNLLPQQETLALVQAITSGNITSLSIKNGPLQLPTIVSKDPPQVQKPFLPPPPRVPVPLTTFCGRTEELDYVMTRLQASDCRLLTLLGMGGSGKTRLALEVARLLPQDPLAVQTYFPDGLYFMAFEALTDGTQIIPLILEKLGFSLKDQASPQAQMIQSLNGKKLLLILDNFERFVNEAPLLTEFMLSNPNLKILVTSRTRLALQEEECVEIRGLDYPREGHELEQIESIPDYGAVQLFIQRARRLQPRFSLDVENAIWIIKICQLLDGLPLALELASEQVRSATPQEIAQSLAYRIADLQTSYRNYPPRHASLRAVLEHAWGCLTPDEQEAFPRLSVFQGGFTRVAASELGLPQHVFFALLDKSLLYEKPDGRYDLHPVLRHLASEKLSEAPVALREASFGHSAYYLGLLTHLPASLQNHPQIPMLKTLASDIENIRKAWALALAAEWLDLVQKALEGYYLFYWDQGLYYEGEWVFQLAAQMLARESSPQMYALRGQLLQRQGRFCVALGRIHEAQACFEASHLRTQETEDAQEIALSLRLKGPSAFPYRRES